MIPGYLSYIQSGELARRVEQAYAMLESCRLCAHGCRINRRAGKLGVCRTGERARLAGYGPHQGEERPLSGTRGSGTVFFSRCNLRCIFCQNADISQDGRGNDIEPEELARIFLSLQNDGCHNINLVSPTHVVPQILAGLLIAAQNGLHLPLVYNTGGYDTLETLALLDGIVDIYLPDMKYADRKTAHLYSGPKDYPRLNQAAVKEMYRLVGGLVVDDEGVAVRGLLVRHLVLPDRLAGTREIARFLAEEVSPQTVLNVMDQYHPAYKAESIKPLDRRITPKEYDQALQAARSAGLKRLYSDRDLNLDS
jgi:putative pyruvate formate lyase activating enzyme